MKCFCGHLPYYWGGRVGGGKQFLEKHCCCKAKLIKNQKQNQNPFNCKYNLPTFRAGAPKIFCLGTIEREFQATMVIIESVIVTAFILCIQHWHLSWSRISSSWLSVKKVMSRSLLFKQGSLQAREDIYIRSYICLERRIESLKAKGFHTKTTLQNKQTTTNNKTMIKNNMLWLWKESQHWIALQPEKHQFVIWFVQ